MEYRRFGRSGVQVPVFTLGAMRFPHVWEEPHDHLPEDSRTITRAILDVALRSGMNLIETASGYGKSERLIGQALAQLPYPPTSYRLMTKASPTDTADQARQVLANSLERLQVQRVTFFAIHGINTDEDYQRVFQAGGMLQGLEQARRDGWFDWLGFSTHASWPLITRLLQTGIFDFVNLHYYWIRSENRRALDAAVAADAGVLIISPNDKGGLLYQPPPHLRHLTAPLHPVNYNERWLLAHPEVHTLSIGLSEPGQERIHLDSLSPLPYWGEAEMAIEQRLDAAALASPWHHCGLCRGCLPCPKGIEIPDLLRLLHLARTFAMLEFARGRYQLMQAGDRWVPGAKATECNDCNDCLPRCPEGLPIPSQLRQAHALMSGATITK